MSLNYTVFDSDVNRTVQNYYVSNSTETFAINWQALGSLNIVTALTAFVANGIVLLVFFRTPSLRHPFNFYLMGLLITNCAIAAGMGSLDVYVKLNRVWELGNIMCTCYKCTSWVLPSIIYLIHLFVAINRMWAVFWPMHYRSHHNKNVAVGVLIFTFVGSLLWTLPYLIIDQVYYRLPVLQNGCKINFEHQQLYGLLLMILNYNLPMLIIVTACPLVLCARHKRHARTVMPQSEFSTKLPTSPPQQADLTDNKRSGSIQPELPQKIRIRSRASRSAAVMVSLTLALIVFWGPNLIYFDIVTIWPETYTRTAAMATTDLLIVQAIVDPLLLAAVMTDVRSALKVLFRRQTGTVLRLQ